ncbi:cytochrome C oxidase assembly protein [Frigidibacter sp. ROC022]|uniref:cytochrome C oxidase assembly protein n=1 Tax=Frigidibacter sp. ROC022 TaxID=2971796 RepID=UPI00215A75DB|nr:cytochrome C oxidase assembly protein [Frigidibacter sp. ROC022]MCR8723986.1 cytochrome C oxidase assembly protein [Frigidibacter sp. ROC022]
MPITQEHELHRRRRGRNYGLGLVLGGFVALVFALTMVKVTNLGATQTPGAAAPAVTTSEDKP